MLHLIDYVPRVAEQPAIDFLDYFILSNLVLGLFNLLPVPPLDGGRIVVGLLPERAALLWARLERAGILIVIVVVFLLPRLLPEFGIHFDPVGTLLGSVLPRALNLIWLLAGLHDG
jgi:Zn-dependent protease